MPLARLFIAFFACSFTLHMISSNNWLVYDCMNERATCGCVWLGVARWLCVYSVYYIIRVYVHAKFTRRATAEFQFSYFRLMMLLPFPPPCHSPAALACRNLIQKHTRAATAHRVRSTMLDVIQINIIVWICMSERAAPTRVSRVTVYPKSRGIESSTLGMKEHIIICK